CAAHASTATTHTGLAACSAHRPANGSGNDELTLAYRCIRLYWWLPIVTGVWRRIRSGSAVATGRDLTSVRDSPSRPFSQRRGVPSTTRPRWRGAGQNRGKNSAVNGRLAHPRPRSPHSRGRGHCVPPPSRMRSEVLPIARCALWTGHSVPHRSRTHSCHGPGAGCLDEGGLSQGRLEPAATRREAARTS